MARSSQELAPDAEREISTFGFSPIELRSIKENGTTEIALDACRTLESGLLSEDQVARFLRSRSRYLSQHDKAPSEVPMDLLTTGAEPELAREAANAFVEGYYL